VDGKLLTSLVISLHDFLHKDSDQIPQKEFNFARWSSWFNRTTRCFVARLNLHLSPAREVLLISKSE
jgi:hypothetical protein